MELLARNTCLALLLFLGVTSFAQNFTLSGTLTEEGNNTILRYALLELQPSGQQAVTDTEGKFSLENIPAGEFSLTAYHLGFLSKSFTILVNEENADTNQDLKLQLSPASISIGPAEIFEEDKRQNLERLPSIQNTVIYKGMKTEVLSPAKMEVNLSTNNSRQVYSKVPGITVWESDGAGIQLGIGARGLSPNRTSHFNVRQNRYDISADALGYPESYYTPPLDAVERIEIVRGSAALQYGSQFGGLLNFKLKEGLDKRGKEFRISQSVGTFGLYDSITSPLSFSNTTASFSGSNGPGKVYSFYQFKTGESWRPNSDFDVHTALISGSYQLSETWKVRADFTHMSYLAQQPGGLTDVAFASKPRASNRERNWFRVGWNLASFNVEHQLSPLTEISSQFFGLSASREALGFLGETQRIDPLAERDLISGTFQNFGNETRIIHKFFRKQKFWAFAGGLRLYKGLNKTRQGSASAGSDADFNFVSRPDLPESNYTFPNQNLALFAQSIIPLGRYLSITPGLRYELIDTRSDGQFLTVLVDGAGNLIESEWIADQKQQKRDFLLFGGGLSYKKSTHWEMYANAVQNYRAINFSDIQIRNTSLIIDSLIQDERGYNADLGLRGSWKKWSYDVSLFALIYNDRIGEVNRSFDLLGVRRFRTNISDARSRGIESFIEYTWLDGISSPWELSSFANFSLIDAQYTNEEDAFFFGKRVELVPDYTAIFGSRVGYKNWTARMQWSMVGQQFSDASNVGSNPNFPATANAVDGIIPAYQVLDANIGWKNERWSAQLSVNNALNTAYFTRRASGYPGPGIIPSDGRGVFLRAGVKI